MQWWSGEDRGENDPRAPFEKQDQRKRPQQIELFFDAERPEMAEDPVSAIEVAGVGCDGSDVEPGQFAPVERDGDGHENIGGGKNAIGAANIEILQRNCSRALMLAEELRRDEVSGENKENAGT